MLRRAWDALDGDDRRQVSETRRLDGVLDRLNTAIKSYVTRLDPEDLSPADQRRLTQLLAFTTNIERAGDVLDRNVMALAARRLKRGLALRPEDRAKLSGVFDRLSANLRTAGAVFMTEDAGAARALAAEKEVFRELERQAMATQFAAFRRGPAAGAGSGTLFLDVLRDLKAVNTHLVAAAAYPVLDADDVLPGDGDPSPSPRARPP